MLFSLAVILFCGLLMKGLMHKLHLPGLVGMLIVGIAIGPYALNLIDESVLHISADIRKIALVIILLRAGLSLQTEDLKAVGRPAFLLCFMPACFEIGGIALLALRLLPVTMPQALIMGAVVAAVSPAVIVPRMLHLMEAGYGTEKKIPQMILAGASVDDIFVIVLFTSFLGLESGSGYQAAQMLQIPLSILLGVLGGAGAGLLLSFLFARIGADAVSLTLITLSAALFLTAAEGMLENKAAFSGLLAVMAMGLIIKRKRAKQADMTAAKLKSLWSGAEILLFILVGATVDGRYAAQAGPRVFLLICGALVFRIAGVYLCTLRTGLNKKERLFCAIAYLPKATVQAAIGAVPLAMGLACGQIVLTAAVLSILLTAPVGAILIDRLYPKLLTASLKE